MYQNAIVRKKKLNHFGFVGGSLWVGSCKYIWWKNQVKGEWELL